MPGKKSKKKAGNERGFATTSTPAKLKDAAPETDSTEKQVAIQENFHNEVEAEKASDDIEEAQMLAQSTEVVENGGRQYTRLWSEVELEKRARKSCSQLSLPEILVERILRLGSEHGKFVEARMGVTDALRYLYTAELMLKRTGVCQSSISIVLKNIGDVTSLDALLYYVSRATKV